jgi:3,4-dihydroxy-2-butanone 4-phosphate synthase
LATPAAINFMAREARGLICTPMAAAWIDRLELPSMVAADDNTSRFGTAFTISVEARDGITTGISAYDRAVTIAKLADPQATRSDFALPGHVLPCAHATAECWSEPARPKPRSISLGLPGCNQSP